MLHWGVYFTEIKDLKRAVVLALMNPWKLVSIILVVALVATVGVSTYHLWEAEEEEVIIATTTSLKDTKLLDEIAVEYKKETGVNLRFIAKGTGESLKMAKTGDVDMVLVHAPESEKKFLEDGSLVMRKIFAYNFFVIVGPTDDPADISGLDAIGALTAIYDSNQESDDKNDAQWASRGDESGTHLKEKELWRKAG
jgi:tungstate transport system substrate-binding protein